MSEFLRAAIAVAWLGATCVACEQGPLGVAGSPRPASGTATPVTAQQLQPSDEPYGHHSSADPDGPDLEWPARYVPESARLPAPGPPLAPAASVITEGRADMRSADFATPVHDFGPCRDIVAQMVRAWSGRYGINAREHLSPKGRVWNMDIVFPPRDQGGSGSDATHDELRQNAADPDGLRFLSVRYARPPRTLHDGSVSIWVETHSGSRTVSDISIARSASRLVEDVRSAILSQCRRPMAP